MTPADSSSSAGLSSSRPTFISAKHPAVPRCIRNSRRTSASWCCLSSPKISSRLTDGPVSSGRFGAAGTLRPVRFRHRGLNSCQHSGQYDRLGLRLHLSSTQQGMKLVRNDKVLHTGKCVSPGDPGDLRARFMFLENDVLDLIRTEKLKS